MNKKDDYLMKSILTTIAIIGILIKIFLSSIVNVEKKSFKAESTIIGYGLVVCAIASLLFFKININVNNSTADIIKNIFQQSIPYFLVIFLISIIIYLNIKFIDKINNDNLGYQYNSITNVSSFMFLLQLYFLYRYFSSALDLKYNKVNVVSGVNNDAEKKRFKMMTYIFAPINFGLVGIMYIILEKFLTDG